MQLSCRPWELWWEVGSSLVEVVGVGEVEVCYQDDLVLKLSPASLLCCQLDPTEW